MTRAWLVLAALLLVPLPGVASQNPAEPIEIMSDAADDVQISTAAGPMGDPTGGMDTLDLKRLTALEATLDFTFTLELGSLDGTDGKIGNLVYRVYFTHNDRKFALQFSSFPLAGSGVGNSNPWFGQLMALDEGTDSYRRVATLPVEITPKSVAVRVARDLLTDNSGAPPYPGRELTGFWATSHLLEGDIGFDGFLPVPNVPFPSAADRMPNAGESATGLPILFGVSQSGHALLYSREPFRTSNGEASTFVFLVDATNKGEQAEIFEFRSKSQPSGWDVRLPGLIKLAPGQKVQIPIPVRTEFAHEHGSTSQFTLEMASRADSGSVGRVALGLRYPAIPQPAGHHNQLFLHTSDFTQEPTGLALATATYVFGQAGAGQYSYMNAVDAAGDDRDDKVPEAGRACGVRTLSDNDTVSATYCWTIPLDPGLEMGLDFDLANVGAYTIPIGGLFAQPGGRLQGTLVRVPPAPLQNQQGQGQGRGPSTIVATLDPSAHFDLMPNTPHLFTGTITPTKDGNFVKYERGAALMLNLQFRTSRPDNALPIGPHSEPDLMPGGHFTLPLFEYEDPLSHAIATTDRVFLALEGESLRATNPGKTIVFNATLSNSDNVTHSFNVVLNGTNLVWSRLVGEALITLAPGAEARVQIAIAIPADAVDDDRADLLMEVMTPDIPEAKALLRLVATADVDLDYSDEAAFAPIAEKAKESPGPPFFLLLVGLAGLALFIRRRQK